MGNVSLIDHVCSRKYSIGWFLLIVSNKIVVAKINVSLNRIFISIYSLALYLSHDVAASALIGPETSRLQDLYNYIWQILYIQFNWSKWDKFKGSPNNTFLSFIWLKHYTWCSEHTGILNLWGTPPVLNMHYKFAGIWIWD